MVKEESPMHFNMPRVACIGGSCLSRGGYTYLLDGTGMSSSVGNLVFFLSKV